MRPKPLRHSGFQMTRSVCHAALLLILAPGAACCAAAAPPPGVRASDFAVDPQWEGYRNRLVPDPPPRVKQDFGYSGNTRHAGGKSTGEIGGRAQRSTTPATYAKPIAPKTLNDRLHASGRFSVTSAEGGSGVLFGFFSTDSRGWRANNSLCFRLDGNGGKYWVMFEYGTRHWLTGAGATYEGKYQTTKTKPCLADGSPHDWSLDYDPDGEGGRGAMTFTLDGKAYRQPLAPGHKMDGATFDRFGILNQQTTGDEITAWFDDVVVNGEAESFDRDPKWEGKGSRVEFADHVRRPFHDFGYSAGTSHAGGKGGGNGEIGGVIWRDERPAYYGDKVGRLTLDDELTASGTIAFTAAGSDSGAYFGWFDSASKKAAEKKQDEKGERRKNELAILIEGPSRVGHYFRPAYAVSDGRGGAAGEGPLIRPDGEVHRWSLNYSPIANQGSGRISVTFDGKTQHLELSPEHRSAGARFDRFGVFNLQEGGNHVVIYLDDLSYTAASKRPPAKQ
jgi:hypothetical protein